MIEPVWLTMRSVWAIHEKQSSMFGGSGVVRDPRLLRTAVERPRQIFACAEQVSLARLAAAYVFGIVRDRPFLSGNKGTSFLAASVFLLKNGWLLDVRENEAVIAVRLLAAEDWTEAQFTTWAEERLVEG